MLGVLRRQSLNWLCDSYQVVQCAQLMWSLLQLEYTSVELVCQLVPLEQALKGADAAGAKRSRRSRAVVRASSTDMLADLKVSLFELLKTHPCNMRCFVHGEEKEDDRKTLAECDIALDDVVNFVRRNQEDDCNVESVISYKMAMCSDAAKGVSVSAVARAPPAKERGFADTALAGGSTPAAASATVPSSDGEQHEVE